MRKPSIPKINRTKPTEYFIEYNIDVPVLLWEKYDRKRIRIKVYDDINRLKGQEREDYAEERRKVWEYALLKLNYNPFEDELASLVNIHQEKADIVEAIEVKKVIAKDANRKMTPLRKALDLWIESRKERTTNGNSVSTYRVTKTWLLKHFEELKLGSLPISQVTRMHVSEALMKAKKDKAWQNTTFNNEYDTLINLFNWLELEEYIERNPIKGKIEKLPTAKHKNRWYDRDTKKKVKQALIDANSMVVYRVMQFTYFLMIRSKTELMKLKAGDIDRTLKRVRFSAELSKNNIEAYRDYPAEFEKVLDEIGFDTIPANFYIFGSKGRPSEKKCHKDFFAEAWRPIRESLNLSDDYTIYGMKHTRIVHELMKKTDGYDISYMARHEDPKSTKDYMRDYDITLNNVYSPQDLTF